MLKLIQKIATDTLMIRGKYSMKRILVAVMFPYALWIGYRVTMYADTPQISMQVFATCFTFITAVLIVGAYSKKEELKTMENVLTSENTDTKIDINAEINTNQNPEEL